MNTGRASSTLFGQPNGRDSKKARKSRAVDIDETHAMPLATTTEATTFDALPGVALGLIGAFVRSSFSGVCRAALQANPELHYKINMALDTSRFLQYEDRVEHMGLRSDGTLATGRVVTRITVTHCQEIGLIFGCYHCFEWAVKRVVRHSVTTLRSITVKGVTDHAPIIGELVSLSKNKQRVAPKLTRVELQYGTTGVAKAGKAIAAGLWPALEELLLPNCRMDAQHFKELGHGIRDGRVPKLRVLNWDSQIFETRRVLVKGCCSILNALSAGKCPAIEHLSLINTCCHQYCHGLDVEGAFMACPNLRELRMHCSTIERVWM